MRKAFVSMAAFCLLGCAPTMRQQVAFDHNCPEDQVKIISNRPEGAILDVCGKQRRYRNINPNGFDTWTEVTKDEAQPEKATE